MRINAHYFASVEGPKTTAQANKNIATMKEMANYIATTRQGDKENAITELVLGV